MQKGNQIKAVSAAERTGGGSEAQRLGFGREWVRALSRKININYYDDDDQKRVFVCVSGSVPFPIILISAHVLCLELPFITLLPLHTNHSLWAVFGEVK